MKIAYIAGPFTAKTAWGVEKNTRRAEEVGIRVAEMGYSPLIPHANTRYFSGTMTSQFWYDATLALMEKSDLVVLVSGWRTSKGALLEVERALELGIPVYKTLEDLETDRELTKEEYKEITK